MSMKFSSKWVNPVNDQLSVDLGARMSDYSTGQDTDTWKVGAKYVVNDKVTVRCNKVCCQNNLMCLNYMEKIPRIMVW